MRASVLLLAMLIGGVFFLLITRADINTNLESKLTAQHEQAAAHFNSKQEPTTLLAAWTHPRTFKVAVLNDGTRRDGYAEYVCNILYEYGFRHEKVWVQVVDYTQMARNKELVRIGEAHCL